MSVELARVLPAQHELRDLVPGALSPATLRAYETDLRHFVDFVAGVGDGLAPQAYVRRFVDARREAGEAPRTVARRLSSLRSIFAGLVDAGVLDRNPAARVKAPRVSKRSPLGDMTRREAVDLVEACRADTSYRGVRDLALVTLALRTGLRSAELLRVTRADVDEADGYRVLGYVAKGGVERETKLHPDVFERLSAWIDLVAELGVVDEAAAVFVGLKGPAKAAPREAARWTVTGPLQPRSLARMFKRRGSEAGISTHVSPHVLRRTFCLLAQEGGCPTMLLADGMGHDDPSTTLRYAVRRDRLSDHATDYVRGI